MGDSGLGGHIDFRRARAMDPSRAWPTATDPGPSRWPRPATVPTRLIGSPAVTRSRVALLKMA